MGDRWAEIEAMPEYQKAPAYKKRRVKQLFFDKFRAGAKGEERRFVNDGLPTFEQGAAGVKRMSPLDRASAVVDLVAKARGESPSQFRDAAPKGIPLEIPEGVKQAGRDMGETIANLHDPRNALDAAAHLFSGGYGTIASGIAGLAYLPNTGGIEGLADNAGGVDPERAKTVADAVGKALIHQPMTPGGKQLAEAALSPLRVLDEWGGGAGDKTLEATGSPALASLAHAAVAGLPPLLVGKAGGIGRAARGAASRAAQAVKNSTAFRMATVPERGLVLQTLQETLAKNPGLTEGDLARMSDQYFAEAMAKRRKGEGRVAQPSPAMGEMGRPQEAPVAPQEAAVLPEGQGFQLQGRPYGGTNQRPVVPGKHAGQIPEGPRALPAGQGFQLQGRPYGGTNQRPIVPGRERPMLPAPPPARDPANPRIAPMRTTQPRPTAPGEETIWFPDELRAELGAAAEFSKTGRRATVAQDGARWRVDLGPKLERWEMSPQEFLSLRDHKVEKHGDGFRYRKPTGGYVYHDQATSRRALLMAQHEMEVADAVAAGKPVPPEVLRKYPDLAREAAMRETPPPEPDQLPDATKMTAPPEQTAQAPGAKEPWEMSPDEWLGSIRYYRSGKVKSAELPGGKKVILSTDSTPGNFREVNKDFLDAMRRDMLSAASKAGKPVPEPPPTDRVVDANKTIPPPEPPRADHVADTSKMIPPEAPAPAPVKPAGVKAPKTKAPKAAPPPTPEAAVVTPVSGKTNRVTVPMAPAKAAGLSPKEQKGYLMAELQRAMKDAPDAPLEVEAFNIFGGKEAVRNTKESLAPYLKNARERYEKRSLAVEQMQLQHMERLYEQAPNAEYVSIKVPGDGEYKIVNSKAAIAEAMKKAKSFPETTPGKPKAGTPAPKTEGPDAYRGRRRPWYGEAMIWEAPFRPRRASAFPESGKFLEGSGWQTDTVALFPTSAKMPFSLHKHARKGEADPKMVERMVSAAEAATQKAVPVKEGSPGEAKTPVLVEFEVEGGAPVSVSAEYVDAVLDRWPDATFRVGKVTEFPYVFAYSEGKMVGVISPRSASLSEVVKDQKEALGLSGEKPAVADKPPAQAKAVAANERGAITIDFRNRWEQYADKFAPGSAGRKLAEMVGQNRASEGMGLAAVIDMRTFDRFANLSRDPGALFGKMDRWGLPASQAHKRALTYASYRDVADMKLGELRDALPKATRKHSMEFTGYLLARRNLSRVRRGIATDGLTLGDAHAQVRQTAAVANKAGITTQELKDGVRAWHWWTVDNILNRAVESKLISRKRRDAITSENDIYAAFHILEHVPDLENMPDVSMLPGKEWFSVQNEPVIKRMTGMREGQKIKDPIDATLENFMKLQATAERNEVAHALIDDPMWKGKIKRVAQTVEDLDAFHAAGIDAVMKDQWKQAYPDHDTVWRMNEDIPEQFLVPGAVAEAMKQLSPLQVPSWLHGVNNVYRHGATIAYLPFTISNMAIDFVTGYVNSPVYRWYEAPVYLKDWAVGLGHGIAHEFGKGTARSRRYFTHGGGFGFTSELRNPGKARAKVFPTKRDIAKSIAFSPMDLITRIAGSGELAPRMANMAKAERMGIDTRDAVLIGRGTTLDFNQMGTAMRVANSWTPFLSSRFQGRAKTFRAFRRDALDTAAKIAITVAMPGILTYAWNRVNFGDLLDDVSEAVRKKYWVMLTGKSDTGEPQMVLVAKGDVGELWNAVEYGLDQFYGHDTAGMDKFLTNFLSDLSPVAFARKGEVSGSRVMSDLLPPVAKAVIEPTLNKDLYRGRDLVPEWMEKNVRPEDQYFTGTPDPYKAMGQKLGIAPVKIQRVFENIFAGYGRDAMDIGAMGRSLVGRVYREGGGEMERRALEAVSDLEQEYAYARTDAKKAVEAGNKKEALMIMRKWDLGVRKKVAEFDKRFSRYGIRDKGGLRRGVMFTPEKRRRILRGERDERETLEKKLAARGR